MRSRLECHRQITTSSAQDYWWARVLNDRTLEHSRFRSWCYWNVNRSQLKLSLQVGQPRSFHRVVVMPRHNHLSLRVLLGIRYLTKTQPPANSTASPNLSCCRLAPTTHNSTTRTPPHYLYIRPLLYLRNHLPPPSPLEFERSTNRIPTSHVEEPSYRSY